MAQNITRNIPGTSFSSKAAKYRAMAANVSSSSSVTDTSAKSSLQSSSSISSLTHSNSISSSSTHRSLYNTRAQLRTQRMIEEQKRLEEERIKQLVSLFEEWLNCYLYNVAITKYYIGSTCSNRS